MSVADLRAVSLIVTRSELPEDLYGNLAGSKTEQLEALKHEYRRIVEVVHPDKYLDDAGDVVKTAHAAFLKATKLKNEAELKLEAGTYGDRTKTAQAPDPDPPPTVVETKTRKYILKRRFAQGDLCDFYDCVYNEPPPKKPVDKSSAASASVWSTLMEPDEDIVDDPGPERQAAFKIVQSAGDSDLVENEANVLGKLYPATQEDVKYYRYLPKLIDTFLFRSKGGSKRRVNVMPKFGEFFSLAEVIGVHPRGLDYRDVVWMYKRMLVGLGYVHQQNVVHGAVVPPHVLVHPVNHGARIVDWSYAVMDGKGHVKALSTPWKGYYAPEILAKKTPTAGTDIYMATKCAIALLGGDPVSGRMPDAVPKPIQNFLAGCIIANPARRPDDAWKLHDELEEILRNVVGKPKYRPLGMPPSSKA